MEKLISLDEPLMETHGSSRDGLPSQVSPVPLSWRLTLYQSGKIVFQSDKKDIERWEVVQTPG